MDNYRGLPKEWRQLAREAEQKGWRVEITRGNHLRWTAPDGRFCFSGYTSSDRRAIKRHLSWLRKLGYPS